jgi:hypothetical protein
MFQNGIENEIVVGKQGVRCRLRVLSSETKMSFFTKYLFKRFFCHFLHVCDGDFVSFLSSFECLGQNRLSPLFRGLNLRVKVRIRFFYKYMHVSIYHNTGEECLKSRLFLLFYRKINSHFISSSHEENKINIKEFVKVKKKQQKQTNKQRY